MIPLPNLSLGFGDSSSYANKTGDNQTFFGNVNAGGNIPDGFFTSGPGNTGSRAIGEAAVNASKTVPVIVGIIGAAVLLYLFLKKKGKF